MKKDIVHILFGVPIQELVEKTGVSRATIYRFIKKTDTTNLGNVVKLASALDLSVEEMLRIVKNKKEIKRTYKNVKK